MPLSPIMKGAALSALAGACLVLLAVIVVAVRPGQPERQFGSPDPANRSGHVRDAQASVLNPTDVRVVDGDTIRLHDKRPDYRLVGFNTPETRRAKCDAERGRTR